MRTKSSTKGYRTIALGIWQLYMDGTLSLAETYVMAGKQAQEFVLMGICSGDAYVAFLKTATTGKG